MSDVEHTDALAAEYVLGTLDSEEREQARALLGADTAFAVKVAHWERRFGELHLMVEPVEPDAGIWTRIKSKMPDAQARSNVRLPEAHIPEPAPAAISAVAPNLEAPNLGTPSLDAIEATISRTAAVLSSEAAAAPASEPAAAPASEVWEAAEVTAAPASEMSEAVEVTEASALEGTEAVGSDVIEPFGSEPSSAPTSEVSAIPMSETVETAAPTATPEMTPDVLPNMASELKLPPAPDLHAIPVTDATEPPSSIPEVTPVATLDVGPGPAWHATPTPAAVVDPAPVPLDVPPALPAAIIPMPDVSRRMDEAARRNAVLRRGLRRWRAFAILMTLVVLAVAALLAAWKFAPERVPPVLQPSELLRHLGVTAPATSPSPRRPLPPPSPHEE